MKKAYSSLLILLLTCFIMLSGCGAGGGSDNKSSSSNYYIYGVASKGPIRQGFVAVYPLTPDGRRGTSLGTTFTGDDGSYIVGIGGYNGNVLVELKSGKYTDEATKLNKDIAEDHVILRAAVTRINGNAAVMLTPYTEIAVQIAAVDEGGLIEANIDRANALTGTIAGGVDIINTRPANVLSADDIASSNSDEITYGLALASISEMVHESLAGSVPEAISKVAGDLKDDGMINTQGGKLTTALQGFLSNGYNRSEISDLSHTGIDEALLLAMDASFKKDSDDINNVFKILEDLYAQPSLSDTDIRGWFDGNMEAEYLHDGRIKADEADVWTGPGGLYQGVSLSAVLQSPMDISGTGFEKGYWIRVSFSGSNGTGSIITSMVFDGSKWLWYGNREWGVSLSNFQPRAEMTVGADGDVSFTNGFDMVVWDYNLSAYNHGIRSAVVRGPGLGNGVILEHYYRTYQTDSYFSIYPRGSGYSYPLADDVVEAMTESSEYKYTIDFYTEPASQLSLDNLPPSVRTETKTFTRKPYLKSELMASSASIFPVLTSASHDISSLNIGGQVNVSWTNPADTTVNLASLNWTDTDGDAQSALEYPDTNSVTFETSKPADLTAQLYLRGEDIYGRGVSLTWHYWKQPPGSENDVTAINDLFHSLEEIYAVPRTQEERFNDMTVWFDNNVAADYMHDGRDKAKDIDVWTGPGGLYEGISIYAVLLEPNSDGNWGPYETGYRIRLYFYGPGGSGSIRTSVVYDGTKSKWLWYGNQEWGLDTTGFLPWAEKTITSTDVTFDTGFEVIIRDPYLAACNKGKVKSAIITGPGLPESGLKLRHHYDKDTGLCNTDKAYLAPVNTSGSEVTSYSLLYDAQMDDNQIREIPDNSSYRIDFFDVDVTAEGVNPQDHTPVKTLTRTIARGPLPKEDLVTNQSAYFPEITNPVSHELSAANIGGTLDVSWLNPSLMTVNFVSLGWIDRSEGMKYVPAYPAYDTGTHDGHVGIDTNGGNAVLFANLYLRAEDSLNRRFSVTWQFSDSSYSATTAP